MEWKSAVCEIAIPDAAAKYFIVGVSAEEVDCFLKTIEAFRVVKHPSPTRENTKTNMLGVGHQTTFIPGMAHYVLDIHFYIARLYRF